MQAVAVYTEQVGGNERLVQAAPNWSGLPRRLFGHPALQSGMNYLFSGQRGVAFRLALRLLALSILSSNVGQAFYFYLW
jgi:hypothetical protein